MKTGESVEGTFAFDCVAPAWSSDIKKIPQLSPWGLNLGAISHRLG